MVEWWLEQHIYGLVVTSAEALAAPTPGFSARAYMDTVMVVVRGLVMPIPVWGIDVVSARWQVSKANLLRAAGLAAEIG